VQGRGLEIIGEAGGELVTHALGFAEDLWPEKSNTVDLKWWEAGGELVTHALGFAKDLWPAKQ